MISSMTGYSSGGFTHRGEAYKIEVKTLNHRFLDLKIRMPREWNALESSLKTWVESRIKRGSVDLWIERQNPKKGSSTQMDPDRIEQAFLVLTSLKERYSLKGDISLQDLLRYPEVFSVGPMGAAEESEMEGLKETLEQGVLSVLNGLSEMRRAEGLRLREALLLIVEDLKKAHSTLQGQRRQLQDRAKEKVQKRIQQSFEAYPIEEQKIRALLETRVAQEVSFALERLDVEEELTRFAGHVRAIEDLLRAGGAVGKKLDFLFQELNREINTLGNKSQDLEISAEVVNLKVKVEQMREQSLNLE